MDKELKKQIKEDEFASGLGMASHWLGDHLQEAKVTLITVAVLAIAVTGVSHLQERRATEAETAFTDAMEIFQAQVAGAQPPAPAQGGKVYATADEKYHKAATAFDDVATRFSSRPEGMRARYYGALCRIETGALEDAEKTLTELAAVREADRLEPLLARMALADVLARRGQVDRAIDAWRNLASDPTLPFPRDHVLMSLAGALEQAKRPAEAAKSYRQVSDEFPASPYASEAKRRAEFLASPS